MNVASKIKKLKLKNLELTVRLENRKFLGDIHEPLAEQYRQTADDISRQLENIQASQTWDQYQNDPAFLEYLENALQWVENALNVIPINTLDPLPEFYIPAMTVNKLPSLRYSMNEEEKKKDEECAICRMEFDEHEPVLRLCPNNHFFHESCITNWFERTGDFKCPYCKQPIVLDSPSENFPTFTSQFVVDFVPNQNFTDYSEYESKLQESIQQEMELEREINRTRREVHDLERSERLFLLREQLSIQQANTDNLKKIIQSMINFM